MIKWSQTAFSDVAAFKKIDNLECLEDTYVTYTDLEEAKLACANDDNCGKIYDSYCGKDNIYYLCPKYTVERFSESSCIHLKTGVFNFVYLWGLDNTNLDNIVYIK